MLLRNTIFAGDHDSLPGALDQILCQNPIACSGGPGPVQLDNR